eukprot:178554-Rhodomonas_salina.2
MPWTVCVVHFVRRKALISLRGTERGYAPTRREGTSPPSPPHGRGSSRQRPMPLLRDARRCPVLTWRRPYRPALVLCDVRY